MQSLQQGGGQLATGLRQGVHKAVANLSYTLPGQAAASLCDVFNVMPMDYLFRVHLAEDNRTPSPTVVVSTSLRLPSLAPTRGAPRSRQGSSTWRDWRMRWKLPKQIEKEEFDEGGRELNNVTTSAAPLPASELTTEEL